MTVASAEAINEARAAVIAMYDVLRPWRQHHLVLRELIAGPYEAALEALHTALYEATTARAMGCVLPRPSEDGTGPSASGNDHG